MPKPDNLSKTITDILHGIEKLKLPFFVKACGLFISQQQKYFGQKFYSKV